MNIRAGYCNTAISFHGIDNQRIPNFPATYTHLKRLRGLSTLSTLSLRVHFANEEMQVKAWIEFLVD